MTLERNIPTAPSNYGEKRSIAGRMGGDRKEWRGKEESADGRACRNGKKERGREEEEGGMEEKDEAREGEKLKSKR